MFHAWWPGGSDPFYLHNISENTGRIEYYDLPWVPFEIVDGVLDIDYPPSDALYQAALDERMAIPTSVTLELTGLYIPATRLLDITVTASTDAALPAGDYRLMVALTESKIFFNASNGVDWHEMTMRDMFPDQEGTAMTFAGGFPQSDSYQTSLTLDPLYAEDHCEIVFFLQDLSTEENYQAGSVDLMDLMDLTGVAEAPRALEIGANFPNPFNPRTTLPVSLTEAGNMRLDIIDTDGRLVRTLHQGALDAGKHEFTWDGTDAAGYPVGSGVYLYRAESGNATQTNKMMLLK